MRIALWFFLGVGLLLLLGCPNGSVSYRYRLTIEVETPAGLKSGSSVIEVASEHDPPHLLQSSGLCGDGMGHRSAVSMRQEVRGEAVAVDLGDGRTIYALLQSPDAFGAHAFATRAYEVQRSTRLPRCDLIDERRAVALLREAGGPFEVPNDTRHAIARFPTLVRFTDPANPRTVQVLDRRDLARSLGPGYRLRRIVVELTDDPVTSGIERRLPWLATAQDYLRPYAPPPDFVREPERVLTDWAFRMPRSD